MYEVIKTNDDLNLEAIITADGSKFKVVMKDADADEVAFVVIYDSYSAAKANAEAFVTGVAVAGTGPFSVAV
jgi:hypothetical protein